MSIWKLMTGRWGDGAGEIDDVRIDGSTNAMRGMTQEHAEIHGGDHYFVVGYQDLSINEVLDFTWQMPNTTKWIHWTWHIATESETLWQVYENVVATNPLANAIPTNPPAPIAAAPAPINTNANVPNNSTTNFLLSMILSFSLLIRNLKTCVSGPIAGPSEKNVPSHWFFTGWLYIC